MVLLVVAGTLADIRHKKSAAYFFDASRKIRAKGRQISNGELAGLAARTAAIDVLTTAELSNPRRRLAHLLTMYGFIVYAITTAILVFVYPGAEAPPPALLPVLWHLGAAMVCVGGYWFWFFMRVDVVSEGNAPFRLVRADLFVVSLVLSTTFALLWSAFQSMGATALASVFLALYVFATTVLFASIPWSKFAHMFFKPAAALQRRIEEANGTRRNLPPPANAPATFGATRRRASHF
jgi:hypothetical protein